MGCRDRCATAHILLGRDERGRPEVPNGLALCKIHHAAFDAHILGVPRNALLHPNTDYLAERFERFRAA